MKDQEIRLERIISGHEGFIFRHSWSPDGQHIATPSSDGTVKIWNCNTGAQASSYKIHSDEVNSVCWSASGKNLASCSDDTTAYVLSLHDEYDPIELSAHKDEVNDCAWHPSENYVATVSDDKKMFIFELVQSQQKVKASVLEEHKDHEKAIWAIEWSSDGEWIATASDDETIRLYRFKGNEKRVLKGHDSTVRCLKWFSDSKRLISGGRDGAINLWSIDSANPPVSRSAHDSIVTSVSLSFDEKVVASRGNDGYIRFWSVPELNPIAEIKDSKCERWSVGISFSPTENRFASLTEDSKSIKLWNYEKFLPQKLPYKQQNQTIFISYSHKDKSWLKKLITMLDPLVKNYQFLVWSDQDIEAGENWREKIENHLESSELAVFLVSPDFLASKFIMEVELPKLLEQSEKNNTAILWIPIRHSLFEESGLIEYQAGTDPKKPLASIKESEAEAILAEIGRTIHKLLR